jgi:hypothetical protein
MRQTTSKNLEELVHEICQEAKKELKEKKPSRIRKSGCSND